MGEATFGASGLMLPQSLLPGDPMEYAKLMVPPSGPAKGEALLYANFVAPRGNPGIDLVQGFHAFPLPTDDAFWQPAGSAGPCGADRPPPNWGNRDNVCVKSCGGLGAGVAGLASFDTTCERNGMRDLGKAWDVPYCCAPISCGDAAHPAPNWGVRGGKCLPSCGGIGGTASFDDPCSNHDLVDVGAAYDAAFCCTAVPATRTAAEAAARAARLRR
uniref:Uncharacterized protein n=1 Tax=Bicosoecida sp. CB-2014 TaxID=1486930 RepID=A0A7S1CKZ5_9STRA